VVYRSLARYSLDEILLAARSIPAVNLASALAFVAASYLCLTGFDWLAVRYAGHPLSYPRTMLASFTSLSIGHNVGMAAFSSGAVRYRFYSRWGLSAEQVARVIVFCGATVGLGLATLAGLALLAAPSDVALLGLGRPAIVAVAFLCLLGPVAYLLVCWRVRRPLLLHKWRLEPPPLTLAMAQILVGTVNFACVAACIHQLLRALGEVTYIQVASAYVAANLATLVSHVPGGLGVLEATMLGILPGATSIGALVAFRVLYFFVPLMIGVLMLLVSEAYFRRRMRGLTAQPAR